MSLGGRTDLYVFSCGNVNTHTYRNNILDACVHPYSKVIGDTFVLRDDNARPHRAFIMDAYLEQETILPIQWSARSPDLNPTEHV
ncbi:transposable element Tcb1 transposase [Trichonephila clavipes]|nr:transposable element Tcb1 transposase [Trichonephila clavipes]